MCAKNLKFFTQSFKSTVISNRLIIECWYLACKDMVLGYVLLKNIGPPILQIRKIYWDSLKVHSKVAIEKNTKS